MTSGVGVGNMVSGPYLSFLDLQIQEIQNRNRARN
jgi:hypothetical protein